jgi:spore coat protein U-like protein
MQTAGGKKINYKLFSDTAFSTNWDDASAKVSGTGAGLGTDLTFTVYGQIPANQLDSEEGNYSDTVTVTVGY